MDPDRPQRALGARTWLVPAVSARTTWRMPTVGSVPLPPTVAAVNAHRPAHFAHPGHRRPRPLGPGAPTTRTWTVPAAAPPLAEATPAGFTVDDFARALASTEDAPAVRLLPDQATDERHPAGQPARREIDSAPMTPSDAASVIPGSDPEAHLATTVSAVGPTLDPIDTSEAPAAHPRLSGQVPAFDVTETGEGVTVDPRPSGQVPAFDRVGGAEALAITGESPIVDLPPGGHVPRPSSVTWQVPIPPTGVWPEAWRHAGAGLEHGDRDRFLSQARQRLAGGVPVNQVHPPPPLPGDGPVPTPTYGNVTDDLLGTFARAVEEAGAVCHVVEGTIPESLLDHIVADLGGWTAVVSAEPEARELGDKLAARGVEVSEATPDAAAEATLGVTSAIAGVAATGSVVLDSRRAHGRLASLLPPVHLCVLPAERIVATPAEVLRGLGDDPDALPPSLVLVTGPSRTGDIEQLLTIGAHGPTALHVVVVC